MELAEKQSNQNISTTTARQEENGENSTGKVENVSSQISGKMDSVESLSLGNFKILYLITQLTGATLIVLMSSWIGIHMGGFAWTDDPKQEFYWHPFLMTIGLIFLYGNSILIYRGLRQTRKKKLKLIHASIHMAAFILTVIALIAVFDSHNLAKGGPIPNMYSLHSWLGLTTVILFACQWVGGFIAYLVPGIRQSLKEAIMPYHIYFGLTGFVMAIASGLTGLTEKVIFSVSEFSSLPNAGLMANVMGMLMVLFGILVVYLATEKSYKRLPLPEDAILLTGANE